MKRVLILNGSSFVGSHVARKFFQSQEYDVEVTLSPSDDDLLARACAQECPANGVVEGQDEKTTGDILSIREDIRNIHDQKRRPSAMLPGSLRRFVKSVVPRHNDDPDEFCRRLLHNDIIVAVLEDDIYEAECAIKVLSGSHYEVEKTFVLVSSALSWANTLTAERHRVKEERRRAREAERAAYIDEFGDDEELPEELREPDGDDEDDDDESLVPPRDFVDEMYTERVPHPRYQHWKQLEHLVKHANSQTLHTYVLFSGLPYGHGEGLLHDMMRAAWHHERLPLYGPGRNVIPMIHVEDLANCVFKVGSSYDVLEERYMFVVDQGNITQRDLLEAVQYALGGSIEPCLPPSHTDYNTCEMPRPQASLSLGELRRLFSNSASPGIAYFLSDIRAQPSSVLSYYPEEEWTALEGFVEHIDEVARQFCKVRGLLPLRVMVTGPPLCGKEMMSRSLASMYHAPYLCMEDVVADFEKHTQDIRRELTELLVRRVHRKRQRKHCRRRRRADREREQVQQGSQSQNEQSDGDEEGEEDEDEEEDEEDGANSQMEKRGDDSVSELSEVFSEDVHQLSREETVTEKYILGDEDEDGSEVSDDDEEDEEDMSVAQRRARAAAREQDLQERLRIETLRRAYRLALKALSLKTVDGALPVRTADDEETEEEESNDESAHRRPGSHHSKPGMSDDNDGEEGEEEDEENDEETPRGDGDDSIEAEDPTVSVDVPSKPAAATRQGVVRYLDEALALFLRWRLRQRDCLNQGYVLCAFPATVRQACLLFLEETEEEQANRRRRVLPATTMEDLPPPKDADFPLPNLLDMDDAQRASLESAIQGDTLTADDLHEEGVLAPVQETLFPEYVFVLDGEDKMFEAVAEVLANIRCVQSTECSKRGASGGVAFQATPASFLMPGVGDGEGASAPTGVVPSPTGHKTGSDVGASGAPPRATTSPVSYHECLQYYRKHHAPDGPPAESLLSWLQSVCTGAIIGEVPEAVVAAAGDDSATANEDNASSMPPAPTTRTAFVHIIRPPPRDRASLITEAELACQEAARRRGDKETEVLALTEEMHSMAMDHPLTDLARTIGSTYLTPRSLYGPPPTNHEEAKENATLSNEAALLETVKRRERSFQREANRKYTEDIRRERHAILYHQMIEERLRLAEMETMPIQDYLMQYVLPSLTPAMATVVKMRPEDPVTALADILYNYKRVTSL